MNVMISFRPRPLYPRERDPDTNWREDWVNPIEGLDAVE
jgi:hypothetical protein